MILKILRIVVSLLGAIIALLWANTVNIFQFFTFVPQDKAYDVCITVYFTIIESAIGFAWEMICKQIESRKVYVNCTCYTDSNNISISNTPLLTFNDMDIAYLSIQVSIRGNADKLKLSKIKICSMSQMDFQIEHCGTSMTLDNGGNIVINLSQMCGNQKEVYLKENYRVTLIRNTANANAECILSPDIEGEPKLLKFNKNNARIVMGGN